MRAFAIGEEKKPSAFLFNNGHTTAVFEFQRQLELDEISLLLAGRLGTPTAERLNVFLNDNSEFFECVDHSIADTFLASPQSRQLSYFACVKDVRSALRCLRRLEEASIWIVGVGGIGCHVADHLCRIGVRRFHLFDFDSVEESNLNRQILYCSEDIGQAKVTAAAAKLRSVWGGGLPISCHTKFDSKLIASEAFRPSMIFVSADSAPFQLRREIVARAFDAEVPYAFLSYVGQAAAISPIVFDQTGGCGSCATVSGEAEQWFRPLAKHKALDMPPSSYATNAVIAALVVDLWTRSLLGEVEGALDLRLTMGEYSVSMSAAERSPDCPVCGHSHAQ